MSKRKNITIDNFFKPKNVQISINVNVNNSAESNSSDVIKLSKSIEDEQSKQSKEVVKIQIEQKDKNESEVSGILEIENGEEIKDVQSEIIQQNYKYESAIGICVSNQENNNVTEMLEEKIDHSDIGTLLNKNFSDYDKIKIKKNSNSDFLNRTVFSTHKKSDKEVKCYLSEKHFETYNWLVYSRKYGGVFCKYCFFFCKDGRSSSCDKTQSVSFKPSHKVQ